MAVVRFRNPNAPYRPDGDDDWRDGEDGGDYIDENIEEEEKSRKRRRDILRLVLRGAAAAAFVGVIALLIRFLASQRVYSAASYSTIAEVTATDDTGYLALGDRLVYYSGDGASCLTQNGSIVWSISYEMQDPIVSTAGDMMAIGDYNGSVIYIQNSSGTVGSVNTSLPIRALTVSESGEVAAVLTDTDVTWVYLFQPDGSTIAYFKTTMKQSGYPLAVAVSPSGEMVCVSHLITDSSGVHSSLAFYNFGDVGQNVAENNVAGFNYDGEVFPFVRFLSNSVCAAVSDSRIAFFNGREIPESGTNALFTDEIRGVYSGGNSVGLLFTGTTGTDTYSLQIYGSDGNLEGTVPFSMEFTDIQIRGDWVYISSDNAIQIYTLRGQKRYEGSFPMDVSGVIPTDGAPGKLFLVTGTGIEKMTLQ